MNLGEAVKSEQEMSEQVSLPVDDTENSELVQAVYTEADQKLTEFVSMNIQKMQAHLLRAELPDIQSINRAYLDYMPTSLALNRLYQKVRLNAARAKEELSIFDDQAMDEVKRTFNREDNKKTWYSATELKAAAHTKYKTRYLQLQAKYDLAEGRRSFIERLCNAWDSWQYGLGQISRNLIAEANANGLDLRAQPFAPVDPDDSRISYNVDQMLAASGHN